MLLVSAAVALVIVAACSGASDGSTGTPATGTNTSATAGGTTAAGTPSTAVGAGSSGSASAGSEPLAPVGCAAIPVSDGAVPGGVTKAGAVTWSAQAAALCTDLFTALEA